MIVPPLYLALVYLGASIPFGVLISTLFGVGEDVRHAGSGNIGTTNVFRTQGGGVAAVVLTLDLAKGLLAVLLARWLWPEGGVWWETAAGLVAFAGHCLPVYLAFRGGKGVATGAGMMLALAPIPAVGAIVVWAALLAATGRSSVASLAAAASLVVGVLWWAPEAWGAGVALAIGVGLTHTGNLRRLVDGSEAALIAPIRRGRTPTIPPEDLLRRGPSGAPVAPTPPLWGGEE